MTTSIKIRDLNRGLCLFVFTILLFSTTLADNLPFKDNNNISFSILQNNTPIAQLDSIHVEINRDGSDSVETITTQSDSWLYGLSWINDEFEIHSRVNIACFNIVVFQKGRKIESGKIKNPRGGLSYKFTLIDNKLILVTSLINIDTWEYLISLLITIILETLFILCFFKQAVQHRRKFLFFIISFIALNCITHFLVWVLFSNTSIRVLTLEFFVVVAEFIYWKFIIRLSTKKSILASFLTNLISFLFSIIPYLFLGR